jgi:hypothetical protein
LTYSIAYGLIAGIGSWLVIRAVAFPLNYFFGIPDPTVLEVVEKKETPDAEGAKDVEVPEGSFKDDNEA